ncbi:FAD-dependent oxidoreductase [Gordonia sp. (in: high G+C Gram-positive bacteria)]|uniref:FAD-dependent oxidoreductase n=1 Tax=Gordonia sp. (in: high G+C Gram-positive bacteria) TaxID=84139 RepID=UPI0039E2FA72
MGNLGKRAVVLGGSMAGMCAAGAVAPHFDEVVVLERDEIPADAQHRRGVPQSKHPHFLLNSGRRSIEQIFPGYEEALIDAGALHLMPSLAAAHCEGSGWIPRQEGSMTMVYASRLLIERTLRAKLAEVPNIRVVEGVSVMGLQIDGDAGAGGRVRGVWIAGGEEGPDRRLLDADFVVDTLGRGSAVSDWLHKAGWPEVPVQSLDAGVTYTSQWFQKPADLPESWWWAHMSVMPTVEPGDHPPEHDFLCQIFPIEGDRVLVTLGSWGHPMPRKEDEFLDSVHKVRAPGFGRAVDLCEPISKVFVTKSTGNKRRRYDRLPNPPAGLVYVGDAICGFNPFYGQGMSSAAKSALLLKDKLADATAVDTPFVIDYLTDQCRLLDDIWTLALARDQGYANAEGTEIAPRWRQKLAYRASWPAFHHISATTREDPVVEEHFSRVFNLDESVTTFVKNPRVVAGLAWFAVKRAFGKNRLPLGFDSRADPPSDIWRDGVPHPGGRVQPLPKGTKPGAMTKGA